MLHLLKVNLNLIFTDVTTHHGYLRHTSNAQYLWSKYLVGIGTHIEQWDTVGGKAYDEHLAEYRRLRTKHRAIDILRQLAFDGRQFFRYYLTGPVNVHSPVEFDPYYSKAGGCR